MTYYHEILFAKDLVAAAAGFLLLLGGLELLRRAERGRRLALAALLIEVVWLCSLALFWSFHLIAYSTTFPPGYSLLFLAVNLFWVLLAFFAWRALRSSKLRDALRHD